MACRILLQLPVAIGTVVIHPGDLHEDFIRFRIGQLPDSLAPTLNGCLKAALGIA